jgi:hypothetical protein
MTISYSHKGITHTDFTREYMVALGMDEEEIESVLNMRNYEADKSIQLQIATAKKQLSSTDWIAAKIYESSILGNDVAPLKQKYTAEIQMRTAARELINELESE